MKREPSLFRKIIEVHWEQWQYRKAMRILAKQEWSVDFLATILVKATKLSSQGIQLTLTSPAGVEMKINSIEAAKYGDKTDTDIFNRLDDTAAVEAFIREHNHRR